MKFSLSQIILIVLFSAINVYGACGPTQDAKNEQLSSAVSFGSINKIEAAINCGADIEIADEGGVTPLMQAIDGNKFKVVKFLLSHGGNANAQDENGRTPLMYAAEKGNVSIVKLLLKSGAKIDTRRSVEDMTALGEAFLHNQHNIMKVLLMNGAKANDTIAGESLLKLAKKDNKIEVIKLLIIFGAK
jgi:serine/threonine-protein phosphatase 6 regulatory ankyrin repeat subunit A